MMQVLAPGMEHGDETVINLATEAAPRKGNRFGESPFMDHTGFGAASIVGPEVK